MPTSWNHDHGRESKEKEEVTDGIDSSTVIIQPGYTGSLSNRDSQRLLCGPTIIIVTVFHHNDDVAVT